MRVARVELELRKRPTLTPCAQLLYTSRFKTIRMPRCCAGLGRSVSLRRGPFFVGVRWRCPSGGRLAVVCIGVVCI